MPSRPGHPHSENLPWMEVPQPLPAAEEQSDSGGSVVPSIRGESLYGNQRASVLSAERTEENSSGFLLSCLAVALFESPPLSPQQQTKYKKIKRATTVVQSYARGWQVSGCVPILPKSSFS